MPEDRQGNTSVLTRLFHHNTWANLKLLDFCEGLSDEQLATYDKLLTGNRSTNAV